MQLRTNWRTLWAVPITNHINHGRISMHPRTHIRPLVISLPTTSLKRNCSLKNTNLTRNSQCQDLCKSMLNLVVLEAELLLPLRRSKSINPHHQKAVPSKSGKCQHHNSDAIMIEEICLSELITKAQTLNLFGRSRLRVSIITTICPFSSTGADKKSTRIVHLP